MKDRIDAYNDVITFINSKLPERAGKSIYEAALKDVREVVLRLKNKKPGKSDYKQGFDAGRTSLIRAIKEIGDH